MSGLWRYESAPIRSGLLQDKNCWEGLGAFSHRCASIRDATDACVGRGKGNEDVDGARRIGAGAFQGRDRSIRHCQN